MIRHVSIVDEQDEVVASLLSVLDTLMRALDAATEKRNEEQAKQLKELIRRSAMAVDALTMKPKQIGF
ncbi:hypothetical protein [Hyphomicrobium sp. ghe19]|uniref:hypothetical protein n=1 Tax=Hyphomicrobium sp. ghe19 TaxID=2682968 RepID=UPI00136787D2|nr:hypothetical protein HYPP_03749 [Hyphomicrobium sp. ghe19]